jgi:hypothetical protein
MVTLICFSLFQFMILMNGKQHSMITTHVPYIDTVTLVTDIRIKDVDICQQVITEDCKSLIDQMLKCQQIIFNDPGFSYQQYIGNIKVHRKILTKYQLTCEGTQNDYLANDSFDFRKDQ